MDEIIHIFSIAGTIISKCASVWIWIESMPYSHPLQASLKSNPIERNAVIRYYSAENMA